MRTLTRGGRAGLVMVAGILLAAGTARGEECGPAPVRTPPDKPGRPVVSRAILAARAQLHYDPQTNATFTTRLTSDGAVELVAETLAARLRKTVYMDGHVVLEVGRDKRGVVISASADSIEVAVGRKTIRIDPRTGTERDFDRIRALLSGSRAVKDLRAFLAALESGNEEADTDATLAALTGGALVNLLDGDAGSLGRIAKRLERKHNKKLKKVRAVACYPEYEAQVWTAWQDLTDCYDSVSIFWRRTCEYRWFLWIESAWFSFIRCSAFSL